jgi:hypothetical protein
MPATTYVDNCGTPMEVDSVRHRALTNEEHQHRMTNNLCLYCGKAGHIARDCYSHPKPKANALNSKPQA